MDAQGTAALSKDRSAGAGEVALSLLYQIEEYSLLDFRTIP
jgi:hypothetical protein